MSTSEPTRRRQQAPEGYSEAEVAQLKARLQALREESAVLASENAALHNMRPLHVAGQLADDTCHAQVQLGTRPADPAALDALAVALTICRDHRGTPLTAADVEPEWGAGSIHRHLQEVAACCCALLAGPPGEDAQRLQLLLSAVGQYVMGITCQDPLLFSKLVTTLHTAAVELNGQPEQQLWRKVLGEAFGARSKVLRDVCGCTAQVLEQHISDAEVPGALPSANLLQAESIVPDLLATVTADAQRSVVHWQACIRILTPVQLATCIVQSQPWLADPAAIIAALQARQETAAAAT